MTTRDTRRRLRQYVGTKTEAMASVAAVTVILIFGNMGTKMEMTTLTALESLLIAGWGMTAEENVTLETRIGEVRRGRTVDASLGFTKTTWIPTIAATCVKGQVTEARTDLRPSARPRGAKIEARNISSAIANTMHGRAERLETKWGKEKKAYIKTIVVTVQGQSLANNQAKRAQSGMTVWTAS